MALRGIFEANVLSNTSLCRDHYRLTLGIAGFPDSGPGQFVQLLCRDPALDAVDHAFDWSPGEQPAIQGREFGTLDAFLRRPFSIAARRDRADGIVEIDLIGREVGPGTRFLASLAAGDVISVAGPLGNRFTFPSDEGIAVLVGGGVGIPPMIYVAQTLADRIAASRVRAFAFAGALTRDLMSLTITDAPTLSAAEFSRFNVPITFTTDDGTLGQRGFVTEPLTAFLAAMMPADRARTIVYTCGPEPMMKRVQQIAADHGVHSQIAVERAMACGMGTCQSCCIRVKKPDPSQVPLAGKDWCYRLACTDGPVFSGADLLW